MMLKNLDEIKNDIVGLTLDIEGLDNSAKSAAIYHLQETIDLLKLGSGLEMQMAAAIAGNQEPPKKIKLEEEKTGEVTSEVSNEWLINTETFLDNSGNNNIKDDPPNDVNVASIPELLYNGMTPTCEICGSSFPSVGSLDDHMKKCHNLHNLESAMKQGDMGNIPINDVQNRSSPEIQQWNNSSGEWKSHNLHNLESAIKQEDNGNTSINDVQNKTSPEMQPGYSSFGEFKCVHGDFQTDKQYYLKLHMTRHSSNIKCDICDVYFARMVNLRRHREGVVHKTKVLQYQQMGSQDQDVNMENSFVKQEPPVELAESCTSNSFNSSTSFNSDFTSATSFNSDFTSSTSYNSDSSFMDAMTSPDTFLPSQGMMTPDAFLPSQPNMSIGNMPPNEQMMSQYYQQQSDSLMTPYLPTEPLPYESLVNYQQASSDSLNTSSPQQSSFFECNQCDKKFTNKNSLKNHENEHTDKFKCQNCEQRFISSYALKAHQKNPLNCDKILKIRENKRQKRMEEHGVTNTGPTTSQDNYEAPSNPMITHNSEQSLGMNDESLLYQSQQLLDLNNSSTTNAGYNAEAFQYQSNAARDEQKLIDTVNSPDLNVENSLTKMPNIDHEFIDQKEPLIKKSLTRRERLLDGSIETFECPQCFRKFTNSHSFKLHKNIHTDRYKCLDLCQQRFSTSNLLRNHNCESTLKFRKVGLSSKTSETSNVTGQDSSTASASDWSTFDEESDLLMDKTTSADADISPGQQQQQHDVNILQQSYPGISIIPKGKSADDKTVANEELTSVESLGSGIQFGESDDIKLTSLNQVQGSFVKCDECPRTYKNAKVLAIHKNEHTDKFRCPKCGLRFSANSRLQKHLSNPNNCELSKRLKETNIRKQIIENGKIISEDVPIAEEAEQQTSDNSTVTNEELSNFDKESDILMEKITEDPVGSGEQPVGIEETESLQNHNFLHEDIVKPDEAVLEISNNATVTEDDWSSFDEEDGRSNKQSSENSSLKQQSLFECEACHKTYSSKRALGTHKNIHTDKYKCLKCGQALRSPSELKKHDCELSLKRRQALSKRTETEPMQQVPAMQDEHLQQDLVNNTVTGVTEEDCVMQSSEDDQRECSEVKESLDEDIEDDTDLDIDMLSCDICDKYFATQESLNKHSLECKEPTDVNVNVLQQSYPGISIIPKSMMKE